MVWKKTLNETYLVHFYNDETEQKIRVESIFINNAPNEWQVSTGFRKFGELGTLLKTGIKTKSQAVSFAKKYMGSH
jgi:hypothetical protein